MRKQIYGIKKQLFDFQRLNISREVIFFCNKLFYMMYYKNNIGSLLTNHTSAKSGDSRP